MAERSNKDRQVEGEVIAIENENETDKEGAEASQSKAQFANMRKFRLVTQQLKYLQCQDFLSPSGFFHPLHIYSYFILTFTHHHLHRHPPPQGYSYQPSTFSGLLHHFNC